MELVSKNEFEIVAKEKIEYVDKKTGELKNLHKLYVNDTQTGIQEQILVNEKTFNESNKGNKGSINFEKTQNGCYLKGFNLKK